MSMPFAFSATSLHPGTVVAQASRAAVTPASISAAVSARDGVASATHRVVSAATWAILVTRISLFLPVTSIQQPTTYANLAHVDYARIPRP